MSAPEPAAKMGDGGAADYEGAVQDSAAMQDGLSAGGDSVVESTAMTQRAVIANGAVGIEVDDVRATATKIRGMVTTAGGHVAAESADISRDEGFSYLSMDVRVPSDKFDTMLAQLGELGRQTNLSRGEEDVTTQVIDVDARIAAQEASVRRLEALMAKTQSLRDIVALEGELTRRQADLDSLKSQQAWLKDQTSLSTISISLTTPGFDQPEDSGFIGGIKRGWAGLGEALGSALILLGMLLPFLALAAVIGFPIWWVRKRRREERAQAPFSTLPATYGAATAPDREETPATTSSED